MRAQVLVECHERGVVHGDLKLENVMSAIDKSSITLVDLGSASLLRGTHHSASHQQRFHKDPGIRL